MQIFSRLSDILLFPRSHYNVILILVFMVLISQVFKTDCINISKVKDYGLEPYPRVQRRSYTPYSYLNVKSNDKVATYGLAKSSDTEISRRRHVDINKSKVSVHEYGYDTKPAKKEVDSTLDDLLEVLGPHLFLVPFLLKVLPFAIPALPLSYILARHAPATIPEIFMQIMEYTTQINELLFMQQESNNGTGGHEG